MPHHHSAGPDRTLECRELYKHSETFRENHKTRGRKVWGGGIAFCCQESFAGISGIHPVSSTMVNVNITVGTHICLLQRTPVCSTVNEWAEYRSLAGQSLNISFASSHLYWNQPRVTYNPPM
ncbi:mCG142283 [Mus musculus]|nr:mCG142283 [Mus musculus]